MPVDEDKIADNVTKLIETFHLASADMDCDSEGAALAYLVAEYVACFAPSHQHQMHGLFDRCVADEIKEINAYLHRRKGAN
ncbi:hypothetical protein NLM33_18560 [Bradyrhizobium sp. CCGUVB1N3]|uniref:hypothetical protein n=1 Tax=Bradyrhizobium sp. CCGUVB1N3 TaxID=2949629 RepID=UPI0020B20E2F|nr:hypothetical protein [Bradyrhizobium sp. CCGUVB1N3]MCP3472321.1 hypothetical protein [Bradyrhizobium sp. CCGUVB1N3]